MDDYHGPIGALVRLGKFRPHLGVMRQLGRWMGERAQGRVPRIDAVVPIPCAPDRRVERGFDQAVVLAEAVAGCLGVPVQRLLRKRRGAVVSLLEDARARQDAARSHFRGPESCGGRLLLVDDVLTTGASASACADELLAAGAEAVFLWAAVGRAVGGRVSAVRDEVPPRVGRLSE